MFSFFFKLRACFSQQQIKQDESCSSIMKLQLKNNLLQKISSFVTSEIFLLHEYDRDFVKSFEKLHACLDHYEAKRFVNSFTFLFVELRALKRQVLFWILEWHSSWSKIFVSFVYLLYQILWMNTTRWNYHTRKI